jgi:hypothetical protein
LQVTGRQLRRARRRGSRRPDLRGPAAKAEEGRRSQAAKAKIKFGRQIVAIANVEGATAVYSDDADVIDYAREAGLEGCWLAYLAEPPDDPQRALPLEP